MKLENLSHYWSSESNTSKGSSIPWVAGSTLKIVLIYIIAGGVWILLSDNMVDLFISNPHMRTRISIAKGWFFVAGTATMLYFLINRDMKVIRQAYMKLHESEERWLKVFKSSPCLISITTFDEDIYVDVNDTFTNITGYSRNELIGYSSVDLNIYLSNEEHEEVLRILNEKGAIYNRECRFRIKSGETKIWLLSIEKIEVESKQCLINVISDITAIKAAEQEIKKLNEELEHRVKERTAQLEAVNRELEAFSYSVAHDLRTPLRGMDGFSQALLEEYPDKLGMQGCLYLQRIRAASQKMGRLIDDLLELSKLSRGVIRTQDINLSTMVKSIAAAINKNDTQRRVEFIIEEGIKAKGDARLLHIVLENLLHNAWKFTSKHNSARIEFGFYKREDGTSVYYIRDNGAGFDMAFYNKLFKPFQCLHSTSEFEGNGIGLATAYRIIQKHGGEIWAESEVKKGAVFYFTLPL